MFQPFHHNGLVAGFEKRTARALFFFGTRHCSKDLLSEVFPHLQFAFLKQVHGKDIVWADPAKTQTGDGHATRQRNLALVIQTADCMPILFSNGELAVAVHAGWRGIAAEVIPAGIRLFEDQIVETAAIGPHITSQSFEVGNDVAEQLRAAAPIEGTVSQHRDPAKKFADLEKIASHHIRAFAPRAQIDVVGENTYSSPLFHSYRRGKDKGERQFSFVALL
jgi:YfiH family protein